MRRVAVWAMMAAVVAPLPAEAAPEERKPPYYASLAPARARMRTGPGRTFPASWLYVRAGLPVRVVDTFKEWRKIEDPSGTQGWMLGNMVSNTRTAIIQGTEPADMRDRPGGPRIAFRAQPGVVGRVGQCANGWCHFDVRGQAGFVQTDRLWGVDAEGMLP